MLKKVKKWFGIEGLKIGLITEPAYKKNTGRIYGTIVLESKNDEVVDSIKIRLVEKYSRGRGESRLIDEYTMAEVQYTDRYEVPAEVLVEIPFDVSYEEHVSNMDELQRKNFIFGSVVKAAKFLKRAKSTYRLEIEAKVKGTKFSPFATEVIEIK